MNDKGLMNLKSPGAAGLSLCVQSEIKIYISGSVSRLIIITCVDIADYYDSSVIDKNGYTTQSNFKL